MVLAHLLSTVLGSIDAGDDPIHVKGIKVVPYSNDLPKVSLPNICTVDPMDEQTSVHKLLGLLQDTCDFNADGILALLDNDFEEKMRAGSRGKRGKKRNATTLKQAYNDHLLGGGGVDKMREDVITELHYCVNPNKQNGELYCQILLPDGHSGPCPRCGVPCSQVSQNGKETFNSRDLVVRLEEHYKLMAKQTHSDMLQLICDFYPKALNRLSQKPDDPDARVWCPLSGLIARQDFHNSARQQGILLDVEAEVGDTCRLKGELVTVLEKHEDRYVVLTVLNERVVAGLESVEKIGGHFPLVVVVFDDGAEVYKSLSVNYTNDGKTEMVVNIPEEYQDMNRYCALLGTTCGGRTWPNTREVFFNNFNMTVTITVTMTMTIHCALSTVVLFAGSC